MGGPELETLMRLLSRLPGLGPRSARRVALHLLKKRDSLMTPLATALQDAADAIVSCSICGNLDTSDPCSICADPRRRTDTLCVVADVSDIWAMERTGAFSGRYHVTGGLLSALDGVGPDDLAFQALVHRAQNEEVTEVILALPATVDGQTTAHYLAEHLETADVTVTSLAQGVPVGGELDYLDDGTILAALNARRSI